MGMKPGAAIMALLAAGLAACNQAGTDNGAANEAANEVNATEPGPANLGETGEGAGADNGISTTMPVPGTNTPEHVVVNNDAAPNALDGL